MVLSGYDSEAGIGRWDRLVLGEVQEELRLEQGITVHYSTLTMLTI